VEAMIIGTIVGRSEVPAVLPPDFMGFAEFV
jgi:hypothetical protein